MEAKELDIRINADEPSATYTPSDDADLREAAAATDELVETMWADAGWYEIRAGEREPAWAWFDERGELSEQTFWQIWCSDGEPTTVWYMGNGPEPEP